MDVNHTPKPTLHEGAKKSEESALLDETMPPRIAEAALLEVARTLPGSQIISTSIGRGQAARGLWQDRSEATVTLCYLDLFQERLAREDHAADMQKLGRSDERLQIQCVTDLPTEEFDLAMIPCTVRSEAELQREFLQQAYVRLCTGGRLVASVDNPKDRWLHGQMQSFGTKVSVSRRRDAVVYVVMKDKPLKKLRSFDCDFSFRDHERTILAHSRPGVFSHRHLDSGAKALLDAVTVTDGERIVDVGCGAGTVALALAKRATGLHVLAIDSNARAIECTKIGAEKNGLETLRAIHTCEGSCDQPATYDVAVCNPPYYANFRIAKLFVDAARAALRPGGRVYIVTKKSEWYQANMYPGWRDTVITEEKQYAIVQSMRG
jgi:16S rRNA G1207 methylase RsmC